MNKFKEFWNICKVDSAIGGWICLLTSAFMLIASLFIPPAGIIDSSVIAGVGELLGFGALFRLPNIIMSIKDANASVTLSHNGSSITVSSKDTENEKEKED